MHACVIGLLACKARVAPSPLACGGEAGEAATQVVCDDEDLPGEIVIDLDRDGRVLGFEFPFAASTMLPRDLLG